MFRILEKYLERIVSSEKKFKLLCHWLLAVILMRNKKYIEASEQYNLIAGEMPKDPMWRYQSIKCLYQAKKFDEVFELCTEFLSSNFAREYNFVIKGITVNIYWYAGFSAAFLEDYNIAISNFENYYSLIKPKQGRADILEWTGFCYLKLNKYKLAFEYYSKALKKNPGCESVLNNYEMLKTMFD